MSLTTGKWKPASDGLRRETPSNSSHIQLPLLVQKRIDLGVGLVLRPRLPRKEVIQPHLPVRLPCYDFTPITNPTLDACLPSSEEKGLAQRLQVLPTFVV
jgi:hypothetical protein